MNLLTKLSMKLKTYSQNYFDEEHPVEEEGVKIVVKDKKYGLLNATNRKLILPLEYSDLFEEAKGVFIASKDGKMGVVDGKGQQIIPVMYDSIHVASYEMFTIGKYNKETQEFTYGLIDYNNKVLVDTIYDRPIKFSLGYAIVEANGKFGTLSAGKTADGIEVKTAMPTIYEDLKGRVQDGYVAAKFGKKYGYLDMEGQTVIPFKYDMAYEFINGCAAVSQLGKMGIIDYTGAKLVPCRYDDVDMFDKNGLAQVKLNGRYGFVNTKGREVVPCSTIAPIGEDENDFKLNLYWVEKIYKEKVNNITSKSGKEKLMREYRKEISLMYESRQAYIDYIEKMKQKQALTEQYRKDYIDEIHISRSEQTAEQANTQNDSSETTRLLDAMIHDYAQSSEDDEADVAADQTTATIEAEVEDTTATDLDDITATEEINEETV